MTGRASRLHRLEAQARQVVAECEALNAAHIGAALELLSVPDLEGLLSAVEANGGVGLPVKPWEDPPDSLPADQARAWEWARGLSGLKAGQAWPLPPEGTAEVFEQEAAKEGSGQRWAWARSAWLLYATLDRVMG